MITIFHNVTIEIEANGPREAYEKLNEVMEHPAVLSFCSDTYETREGERDTHELRDTDDFFK